MTGEKNGSSDLGQVKDLEGERIRQRMLLLERQSEKLRSRERIFGVGLLVALVLGAIAILNPQLLSNAGDEFDATVISAEHFLLKGADGGTRGRWSVDEDGNSRFRILDRQGRTRLSLSVLSGGSPGLSLSNANGQSRAALALLPDETTSLTLADGAGVPRALLGFTRGDAASILFADASGETLISIGLDGTGLPSIILPEAEPAGEGESGGDR